MKNHKAIILISSYLLSSSIGWAANENSLCNYLLGQGVNQCKSDQSLLGSDENLDKYFVKYDGEHPGNNEQQYYQADHVRWNNSDNSVSLIAEAKKSHLHNFTSGEIKTFGKLTITEDDEVTHHKIAHGAVEIEAIIPRGEGRWPALWMMPYYDNGHTWPSGMEIDILEFMAKPFPVIGTVHYGLEGGDIPTGSSWNYNNNLDLNYSSEIKDNEPHHYGIEWNIDGNQVNLTWYFDGNPYFQITMENDGEQYRSKTRILPSGPEGDLSCSKYTNRCPSKYGVSLSEAAYKSFMNGFNSGYYLIINMAVGGDGVSPEPDIHAFPYTEMKITQVHRYVIS